MGQRAARDAERMREGQRIGIARARQRPRSGRTQATCTRTEMARYKVLKSVARNCAHSFASVMNYSGNDYAMCHLTRRAKLTGIRRLRVDLLSRAAGPLELLSTPVVDACEAYCRDFGRLVTAGGAAMDMIDAALLEVTIVIGRQIGPRSKTLHSRVTARVIITDDRGKEYQGRSIETYECSPLR